jgi:hypothetical protein
MISVRNTNLLEGQAAEKAPNPREGAARFLLATLSSGRSRGRDEGS